MGGGGWVAVYLEKKRIRDGLVICSGDLTWPEPEYFFAQMCAMNAPTKSEGQLDGSRRLAKK